MLEKLDIPTAAGITMNMKRDKAGAIWGYMTPSGPLKSRGHHPFPRRSAVAQ
jgi:hypothetical protein